MLRCGVNGDVMKLDHSFAHAGVPRDAGRRIGPAGRPIVGMWWTAPASFAYTIMVKKLDGQDTLEKTEHLQAIMTAGRAIHAAVIALDAIIADQLGVHRNDVRCLHMLKSGPATAGEVAARTGLTSGSVTALLDRLEAGGHVERQRSTSDRRSVEIAMTECRLRQMQVLSARVEAVIREHFGDMPVSEIADAGRALGSFAQALGDCAQQLEADGETTGRL